MSSFGAIPLDIKKSRIDFIVSSANKCLESVPGFAFTICNISVLMNCRGKKAYVVIYSKIDLFFNLYFSNKIM